MKTNFWSIWNIHCNFLNVFSLRKSSSKSDNIRQEKESILD